MLTEFRSSPTLSCFESATVSPYLSSLQLPKSNSLVILVHFGYGSLTYARKRFITDSPSHPTYVITAFRMVLFYPTIKALRLQHFSIYLTKVVYPIPILTSRKSSKVYRFRRVQVQKKTPRRTVFDSSRFSSSVYSFILSRRSRASSAANTVLCASNIHGST